MKRSLLAGFATLALCAATAWAQQPPPPPGGGAGGPPPGPPPGASSGPALDQSPAFEALDLNHDGKVTSQEWSSVLGPSGTLYRDMDSKHQGYLTLDEMNASHPPASIDTNHDGKLEIDELKAMIKHNYQTPGASGPPQPAGPPPGK